uniref:UmuC domain-containing protein n=1 Tax=Ascaris lumbricoides TaxID=6252 RepID=A0A0M3IXW8_ASCLU
MHLYLQQLANATKRLRYLESADLHLEKIVLTPVKGSRTEESLPRLEDLIDSLKRTFPKGTIGAVRFDDFLLKYPLKQLSLLRSVHRVIADSGMFGASLREITV